MRAHTRNDNYDAAAILDDLRESSDPYKAIARRHDVSPQTVSKIAIAHGLRRRDGVRGAARAGNHWTLRSTTYTDADAAGLTGGRWVRRGLVWVWQADGLQEAS